MPPFRLDSRADEYRHRFIPSCRAREIRGPQVPEETLIGRRQSRRGIFVKRRKSSTAIRHTGDLGVGRSTLIRANNRPPTPVTYGSSERGPPSGQTLTGS